MDSPIPAPKMSEPIEVREATPADAAEVVRLFSLLGHPQPPADSSTRLSSFIAQGQQVLVAERTSSGSRQPLLGAVTLHIMPVLHRPGPIGRLTAVVVDESLRGKGVGRALVAAAERVLEANGCALVEITSNKKRTHAHAFYERLGYTATSFRFAKTVPSAEGTR
jgi:ribosomal protein S18 acetylase RimI-like enzyme